MLFPSRSKLAIHVLVINEYRYIDNIIDWSREIIYLRNKSWKPECVGSFNMDWRILVFYPEPEARDKIY